jgi:hypothetical protein
VNLLRRKAVEKTWEGWPPEGATREELLAATDRLVAFNKQREAVAREQHEWELAEWKRTIADRLLALIPKLESGEDLDMGTYASGGTLYQMCAPRLWTYGAESWMERRRVLEVLPDGLVVPMELRNYLFMLPEERPSMWARA